MQINKRQMAISWSKRKLIDNNVVFLDTETTGIGKNAKVVDLGVIDNKGNILINLLIQPGIPMPSEATAVNGITNGMLEGCPRFVQVFASIKKILKGKTIIAWNSPFDKRVMENEFKNIGEVLDNCEWEDEMPIYADYSNKPKRNKLCIAAKECGIVEEQSHRSVDDCLFTLEVLKYMASH